MEYDSLFYHKEEKIIHAVKNKKYGIINFKNEIIVDFKYDSHHIDFWRKLVIVSISNKFGQIDYKGNIITPLIYSKQIEGDRLDTFIAVNENKKYGIIDLSNNILVPFEYDFINNGAGFSKKSYYNINKGDKWGVLDENYNEALPLGDYQVIQVIDINRIVVMRNIDDKEYGFFLNKQLIIPFKKYYDYYQGWESYNQLLFKTGHMQFDTYTLDGKFIKNCDSQYIKKI